LYRLHIARRPANVDPDIAALRPPKLLESLAQCRDESLSFQITVGIRHQHADSPHPVRLLRVRDKGPRGRTADQIDEIAPSHSIERIQSPLAQDNRISDGPSAGVGMIS
jgi:hypothetical protein